MLDTVHTSIHMSLETNQNIQCMQYAKDRIQIKKIPSHVVYKRQADTPLSEGLKITNILFY